MSDRSYDAVVYDLDGTLVRLEVDWAAVARDVSAVYRERVGEVPSEDLWELLGQAPEYGVHEAVEEAIAEHERAGARASTRLEHADELLESSVPVGVCSLNCEGACRIALETHGLLESVDVVVGRDTTESPKPDPEPLLRAVRGLSAAPERALFVGDSERDELTADRAGTGFEYVGDGPSGH